jgi:phosphopantothenoylcysteine decarboxylase/phosphopantothenate--cysteine ligase
MELHSQMNIEIMSAAVADYKPADVAAGKIKKETGGLTIILDKTKDILAALGAAKQPGQFLTGFALETNNEREYAKNKLKEKHADMIVLNSLRDENAGFGFDTNKVSVFFADGTEKELGLASKKEIAAQIVDLIIQKIHA